MLSYVLIITQWICLLFFIGINLGYFFLMIIALFALPRYSERQVLLRDLPHLHTDFGLPISLIVAALNEEAIIVPSVRSLLQLDYSEYEVVIVNDGSKDNTLEVLKKEFSLVPQPVAIRHRLDHRPVRGVYQSTVYPQLRVIDKENGGCKADALNAGIDASRYSLICPLDADTVLNPDALLLLAQPFMEDPRTIAAGGSVRIANGCDVSEGVLQSIGLPRNLLALFQVMEYLRAFLLARVGWSAIQALSIVSGALGMFHKESVVAVGGYNLETHGEDSELILRLHLHFSSEGKPYRITYVPDAECWTEAPETLKILRRQRVRWHRGFMESLWLNRRLFFHPKNRVMGFFSMPFQFFFEGLGPVIEVCGYGVSVICYSLGLLSTEAFVSFLLLVLGLGFLFSVTSLLLEEMVFHTYRNTRNLFILFAAAVLENFGYRQITSIWRLEALILWVFKIELKWGVITRNASLQAEQQTDAVTSKTLPPAPVNLDVASRTTKEKVTSL